jgi:ribosomal protein S21
MVKSNEVLVNKTLEEKLYLTKMKKQARWETLWEDQMRKAAVEARRESAKRKRAMLELIAKDNNTMMMDPTTMDAYTRELWDLARMDILQ